MAAAPVSPEVAPTMVARRPVACSASIHHAAEQLHGHVLERQRRAVEEFEHEKVGVELHQRRHRRMPEGRVGVLDHAAQVCRRRNAPAAKGAMTASATSA